MNKNNITAESHQDPCAPLMHIHNTSAFSSTLLSHSSSSDAISPLFCDLKSDPCLGEALNEGALPQQRPSSVDPPRAHQGCAAFPFLLEGQGSLCHDNRGGNVTWLGTLHSDLDMLIRLCSWMGGSACDKTCQVSWCCGIMVGEERSQIVLCLYRLD